MIIVHILLTPFKLREMVQSLNTNRYYELIYMKHKNIEIYDFLKKESIYRLIKDISKKGNIKCEIAFSAKLLYIHAIDEAFSRKNKIWLMSNINQYFLLEINSKIGLKHGLLSSQEVSEDPLISLASQLVKYGDKIFNITLLLFEAEVIINNEEIFEAKLKPNVTYVWVLYSTLPDDQNKELLINDIKNMYKNLNEIEIYII